MKIGIYGGSFNPVHKGHIEIAKLAIEKLDLDKIIFVPAYKSPFKSKEKYESPQDRVNMINLVKTEKSEISFFEINRKGTSYTIETVKYLKNIYKKDDLFLIIGSDLLSKLQKWKGIDQISRLTKIVVFKRKGSFSKENIKKYNCHLMSNEIFDFSSTEFKKGFLNMVDPKVNQYIGQNYLYIKEMMVAMLDIKRHKHSISVAQYAAKYAKQIDVNPKKAWVAGALHDITKAMPKEYHRQFLATKGYEESNLKDHELHALSGYYWVRDCYMLKDKEIIDAIKKHTSLDLTLTNMDKIIFAADKLCQGRKYPGIQKDRKLIEKDFEKGFKNVVAKNYQILKSKRNLTEKQIKIYERWSK